MHSTYASLLARFGTPTAIAEAMSTLAAELGMEPVKVATVYVWRTRGVPLWVRAALSASPAAEREVSVHLEEPLDKEISRAERLNLTHSKMLMSSPNAEPDETFTHSGPHDPNHHDTVTLPDGAVASSRYDNGVFPAEREHAVDCIQDDARASDAGALVRGDSFQEIEPATLRQAVFETGLKEALDQPTHEARLAALDTLEHQVKRRKVA